MKISEIVKILEEYKNVYGDIKVMVFDHYFEEYYDSMVDNFYYYPADGNTKLSTEEFLAIE
jgi:hypothetical protein